MARSCIALALLALLLAVCSADKTIVYNGLLQGKNSVTIGYGYALMGDGLIINSNSNFSHYLMTTLNPTVAYSTWNAHTRLWESTWSIPPCNLQQDWRYINIQFGCHVISEDTSRPTVGADCPGKEPVMYSIEATEYNGSLPLWNPAAGMFRWNVTLGGGSASTAAWNFTLLEDAPLLRSDATLHITLLTEDGSPSSAAVWLFDHDEDETSANCDIDYTDPDAQAAFAGTNAVTLSYTGLDDDRVYQLIMNGTEPRQNYIILARVSSPTSSGWSSTAVWVVIVVAVGCFVVGAIIAALISAFVWRHPSAEREPLVRS